MKCIKEKCRFYFPMDNDADSCMVFNEIYELEYGNEKCKLAEHTWDITKQLKKANEQFSKILKENGFSQEEL